MAILTVLTHDALGYRGYMGRILDLGAGFEGFRTIGTLEIYCRGICDIHIYIYIYICEYVV